MGKKTWGKELPYVPPSFEVVIVWMNEGCLVSASPGDDSSGTPAAPEVADQETGSGGDFEGVDIF